MDDAQIKAAQYWARKKAYFDHLDARVPELQAMGKPGKSEDDPFKIARNLDASHYPGAQARIQADKEWAQMEPAFS